MFDNQVYLHNVIDRVSAAGTCFIMSWTPSSIQVSLSLLCAECACICVLQLITQQGITAGLEADQEAKLGNMAAAKTALHKQEELTQAAQAAFEATQAELSHCKAVIAGLCMVWKLTCYEVQ